MPPIGILSLSFNFVFLEINLLTQNNLKAITNYNCDNRVKVPVLPNGFVIGCVWVSNIKMFEFIVSLSAFDLPVITKLYFSSKFDLSG